MEYFKALGNIHVSTGVSLLAMGRNELVKMFLKGDSEWLWSVDTDMVFDKGHWLKLVTMAQETGADMVTGLAFMYKNGALIPSAFYTMPDGEEFEIGTSNQLPVHGEELAACGMASVLINRRVLEALEAPRHEDYRWFDQIVGKSGRMSGEDTQFFMRAREAGFTLRINTEAETWHMKDFGLGREDFIKQKELASA